MKKIMGAVIVGLCSISFDATCMYKPLGEQKSEANDAGKPSRPHHETIDDIVAGIKAACSPQEYRDLLARMQQDYEEQQTEEEAKRREDAAVQEAIERLKAQKESRDSPRIKAH